jgi:diguanylate cyclase (GGDEF)-like protein
MRFQATHDPLTSFLNRGAILEMLNRELARSSRERTPIAVLMADLDHFKEVNDKYGHLTGDQVLRDIGDRLLHSVRPYDLIGRYGGEEFLIVFPNCIASDARDRAEELRRIIRDRPITTSDGAISISVSIGVVSIVHNRPTSMEPDEILREADAALYAAKRGGRDRCIAVYA